METHKKPAGKSDRTRYFSDWSELPMDLTVMMVFAVEARVPLETRGKEFWRNLELSKTIQLSFTCTKNPILCM